MTEQEIRDRIETIRQLADDADGPAAHIEEDRLHTDFLTYLAEGVPGDVVVKAKLVLETSAIEFDRWYE